MIGDNTKRAKAQIPTLDAVTFLNMKSRSIDMDRNIGLIKPAHNQDKFVHFSSSDATRTSIMAVIKLTETTT